MEITKEEYDRLIAARDAAIVEKNNAYSERNKLIAAMSKRFPACLGRHDENDKDWEDGWRNVVFIYSPECGQMSWHIHDSDLPMFNHLPYFKAKWDGHTTEEKYQRLSRMKQLLDYSIPLPAVHRLIFEDPIKFQFMGRLGDLGFEDYKKRQAAVKQSD